MTEEDKVDKINRLENILENEDTLSEYIKKELPPRLSYMTEERRLSNVTGKLVFKLWWLKRSLDKT